MTKSVWSKDVSVYGCSFVAKLSWKKNNFFLKKYLCFLQNIYVVCRKKCFDMEKKIFVEKNVNENAKKKKKNLIPEIYFYTENVCVTNKT